MAARVHFESKHTSIPTDNITGTGTINQVAKFTGANAIGDSIITANGTNVGIGTSSPTSLLHLSKAGGVTIKLGTSQNTSEIEAREVGATNNLVFSANNSVDNLVIDNSGDITFKSIVSNAGAGLVLNELNIPSWSIKNPNGANGYLVFTDEYNSSEYMRITNTGNVGIGTSSPGLKLNVLGATGYPATSGTTQTGVFRVSGGTGLYNIIDMGVNETTDTAWIQATRANNLSVNDKLAINPNGGNVGIGSSSPSKLLTVSHSVQGDIALFTNTTDADLHLNLTSGVTLLTPSTGILAFGTSSTEKMRITSTGIVAIGTTSPSSTYKLNVAGGIISKGTAPALELYETDSSNQRWILGGYGGLFAVRDVTGGTYPFQIEPAAPNDSIRIDSTGNVGIGTNSPTASLQVEKSSQDNILAVIGQSGYEGALFLSSAGSGKDTNIVAGNGRNLEFHTSASATPVVSGTQRMMISAAGNVGIGTTAPTSKLHVTGLLVFANNADAVAGGLTSGAFYTNASGTLSAVL